MKRDKLVQFYRQHRPASTDGLSVHAKARVKARVFQHLTEAPEKHTPWLPRSWTFTFSRFALVAVFMLVLLTGTAYASASAIPGDVLYPVKRAVENTRVKLASSPETKAKLQVRFTEERLQELEKVETKTLVQTKPTLIKPEPLPHTSNTTLILTTPDPAAKRVQTKAEHSAREEVSKALEALEQTRANLTQQGKTRTADDLADTIHTLTNRAHRNDRKRDRQGEDNTNSSEKSEQKTSVDIQDTTEHSGAKDQNLSPFRKRNR